MRVAESKYLLLDDEALTLKYRLATGVFCNVEMKECVNSAGKDVLDYMNTLHSKGVKSQNTVRKLFCGNLALLVHWLQTLFTQKVSVVFISVDNAGCEASFKLSGSICDYEVAA